MIKSFEQAFTLLPNHQAAAQGVELASLDGAEPAAEPFAELLLGQFATRQQSASAKQHPDQPAAMLPSKTEQLVEHYQANPEVGSASARQPAVNNVNQADPEQAEVTQPLTHSVLAAAKVPPIAANRTSSVPVEQAQAVISKVLPPIAANRTPSAPVEQAQAVISKVLPPIAANQTSSAPVEQTQAVISKVLPPIIKSPAIANQPVPINSLSLPSMTQALSRIDLQHGQQLPQTSTTYVAPNLAHDPNPIKPLATGLNLENEAPQVNDVAKASVSAAVGAQELAQLKQALAPDLATSSTSAKERAFEALSEQVNIMLAKNLKHAEIRLDPPELGRLQIKLSVNQDSASVQFVAASPVVKEMLEQSLPRLREMFLQNGLQLTQSSVQQESTQQQHSGGQQHGFRQHQPNSHANQQQAKPDWPAQPVSGVPSAVHAKQGIDYYA